MPKVKRTRATIRQDVPQGVTRGSVRPFPKFMETGGRVPLATTNGPLRGKPGGFPKIMQPGGRVPLASKPPVETPFRGLAGMLMPIYTRKSIPAIERIDEAAKLIEKEFNHLLSYDTEAEADLVFPSPEDALGTILRAVVNTADQLYYEGYNDALARVENPPSERAKLND